MSIKEGKFVRDEYGRQFVAKESLNSSTTFPLSDPDWAECEEVWARAERLKRLEDTVIMLTDRVNQCNIRIAVLETSPLEKIPEPRERVCDSCKWGTPINDYKNIDCHYDPHAVRHTPDWWCSRWEEK